MPVNLDAYATPADAPATQAARREALLAQLGWLTVEAEALGPLLRGRPASILTGRPGPDALSIHETFGLLAALDREVHTPQVARMLSEDTPTLSRPQEAALVEGNAWNDAPLETLLASMRDAREALIAPLAEAPVEVWGRTALLPGASGDPAGSDDGTPETITLATYALRICQHDADRLRDLAYRLHESKLTDRAEDLPK
ncbi:MAG: hypothetical protein AAGG50_16900 [Bacteroidota bacterium]